MHTLNVELGSRSYPIHIGPGLLSQAPSLIQPGKRQLRLITDSNVAPHYLAPLRDSLGLREEQIRVLPAGEGYKTWDSAGTLLDWLLQTRLSRDGWLIALGGGVMGDLIGFAAAIYQRGVDFVQVPTTLLAQVDSSVGGKTGVNHARGKNMIGAFHQPRLVLADTDTLRTLPHRELLAGLAEVIKYGMLADATFFDWLEAQIDALLAQDASAMAQAIRRSCELKAGIVAMDERETVAGGAGPRAWLNLGHTFGHAIETWTGYTQWLHGEAVGAGLCMAADLSAQLGWISDDSAQRCIRLVGHAGLPTRAPAGMRPQDFRELMQLDKKVASGRLRLVLMRKLGEACVSEDFDDAALAATLDRFTRD